MAAERRRAAAAQVREEEQRKLEARRRAAAVRGAAQLAMAAGRADALHDERMRRDWLAGAMQDVAAMRSKMAWEVGNGAVSCH